ncbi:hypothetical protein [Sphingomonas abietis]|uniref:Uncharacterized protein n=1 Tax=Sphingomonas abietis TaxID=3012344 RepID=A0ABY7NPL7_9SPHN|nr:hypothetical protein [Sphingomonas abietis]WBO23486.1 hypothetical protein PBT88_04985 [Sphingomonas abietis]
MKMVMALAAAALLIAAAPMKITPAPADDKPAQPVGAAARAKHGPEPLAKPADDIGAAEDPAPIASPPPAQPK